MDNQVETENYKVEKFSPWAGYIEDHELIERIKDSDFAKRQIDEGRDFATF
jgi:hypothetical protein